MKDKNKKKPIEIQYSYDPTVITLEGKDRYTDVKTLLMSGRGSDQAANTMIQMVNEFKSYEALFRGLSRLMSEKDWFIDNPLVPVNSICIEGDYVVVLNNARIGFATYKNHEWSVNDVRLVFTLDFRKIKNILQDAKIKV